MLTESSSTLLGHRIEHYRNGRTLGDRGSSYRNNSLTPGVTQNASRSGSERFGPVQMMT